MKGGRRAGRRGLAGGPAGKVSLRGKVLTIEGLVGRDVPWSTIAAATGIDEETFDRLKHQLDAAADATHN